MILRHHLTYQSSNIFTWRLKHKIVQVFWCVFDKASITSDRNISRIKKNYCQVMYLMQHGRYYWINEAVSDELNYVI